MPCPTCSHAVAGIGYGMSHCPRCGTLVNCQAEGNVIVIVPMLVGRCKAFYEEAVAVPTNKAADVWRRRGIAEAINVPAGRPRHRFGQCECCHQPLGLTGGYGNSRMCGPCYTGDATTLEEIGETW